MINISTDIVNSINTSVSTAFQELLPVFAIILSVVISFFAIRKIIFLITLAKR